MPDIYVDTDVTPGGSGTSGDPYSTLHEAWEGEEAGIGAGETWNFFCAGSTADTSVVVIDGVFAQASGVTINIHPWHTNFGASSDKDDGWNTGNGTVSASYYQSHQTSGADGIYLDFGSSGSNSNTINIEGIQVTISSSTSGARLIGCNNGNVNDHVSVVACRLQANQTGGTNFPRGVRTDSNCFASVDVINCLLVYAGTAPVSFFNINKNHSQTFRFINNTCVNTSTGGEDTIDDAGSSNIVRAINNAIFHSVPTTTDVEFDLQAGTKTVLTNATPVSGDRGGGTDIVSGDFNSYSTDFRPAASQTNAWGTAGTTNGTNSNVPTTDILGDPRNTSGNTAIGCFAIIAGEGGAGATDVDLAAGSYTLTGNALGITFERNVDLGAGSYALTGYDITVSYTTPVALDAGSYTVTGYDLALTFDRAVDLAAGTYTLTGNALGLTFDTAVDLDAGSYTVTGYDLSIQTGTGVSLDAGSYTVTGYDLGITFVRAVDLAAGSYTVTGYDLSIELAGVTNVSLDAGSYTVSGYDLTIPLDRAVDLAAGSYTLTGYDIGIPLTRAVDLGAGSYTVTGHDLTIDVDQPVAVDLDTGSLTLTGYPLGINVVSLSAQQPGGWLPRRRVKPIIYVDEDGTPVDITAPVEEAIEAAPEAKQETIRKAVERVTEQTKAPTIKAVGRAIQRIDAAAFKRFYEAEKQRADDDDVAAILLLAA